MRGVPECLNRRYRALDDLVNELSSSMTDRENLVSPEHDSQEPGIRLMCNFWNILKEEPDCDLPQAVQQRMCTEAESSTSCCIPAQRFTCFMARSSRKLSKKCCKEFEPKTGSVSSRSEAHDCNPDPDLPINKVLGHLKEAASFDKKCTERLNSLLSTEKLLNAQIGDLETKEKDGVMLLKKADCMWSCMDEAYKERIAKSNERKAMLQKQLREIEASASKWRKNKKDLESQLDILNKQQIEVTDKINQKQNDMKYLDMEIAGFQKRIEGNKTEITGTKDSLSNKKKHSDAKIATISAQVSKLEADLKEERKRKEVKDKEGAEYIKEARAELQKICRVLLLKKLEKEDRTAEKEGLLLELDLLKETSKKCKEKCTKKEQTINAEIKKINAEITAYKARCIQCHECVDTADVRKFCTDCPKCAGGRECVLDKDHCDPDHSFDCVCQMVKQKFLDNVFDNMYTVLERQSRTGPGKAVAEAVMQCLKNSRNGKLNGETRAILQNFILTTVKNNLNLTIVGGAVKTRCEMDAETYKQLMTCLKQVKVTKPPKVDKGTNARKDPCHRWGGTNECNCPKGPKACICTKKAPPPPHDPAPCPEPPKDMEDVGEKVQCPFKKTDTSCGVDCAMHQPTSVSTEVAKWRPDPCQGPSCNFPKNMRAAQCILGPESLSSGTTHSYKTALPDASFIDSQVSCTCGASTSKKPCTCFGDLKQLKAEKSGECCKDSCAVIWEKWSDVSPNLKLIVSDVNTEFFASEVHSAKIDKTWKVPIDQNVKKPEELDTYSRLMLKNDFSSFVSESTAIITKGLNNTNMLTNSNRSNSEFSNIVSLVHTATGPYYVIELDAKTISQINKKNTEDPVMFVGIKETVSGHCKLVFNPPSNMSLVRISVKKTPSGHISLEVDKSAVKTLVPSIEHIFEDGKSSVSISITKRRSTQMNNIGSNEEQSFYIKKECGRSTEHSGSSSNRKNITSDSEYNTTVPENIENYPLLSVKKDIEVVLNNKGSNEEHSFYIKKECGRSIEHSGSSSNRKNITSDSEYNTTVPENIESYRLLSIKKDIEVVLNNKGNNEEHSFYIKKECGSSTEHSGSSSNKKNITSDSKYNTTVPENIENYRLLSVKKDTEVVFDSITQKEGSVPSKIKKKRDFSLTDLVNSDDEDMFNYRQELKKIYEERTGTIKMMIQGEKEVLRFIKADVTKTSSGNMALDLINVSSIGEISSVNRDHPVLLKRSLSGTYTLFVARRRKIKAPNAVLRRTSSGRVLVKITTPILKSMSRSNIVSRIVGPEPKLFKIRTKGSMCGNIPLQKALLKLTPSENYILVLDKEFEIQHTNTIQKVLGIESESYVELSKIDSDTVLINFDKSNHDYINKQNAVLVKSPSGHLKVYVNGPILENLSKRISNVHQVQQKTFEELLLKPLTRESKMLRDTCTKFGIKSVSETNLNEKIRINFQLREGLFAATLKRTPSGEYAVFLSKESKKTFLHDLKNFLAHSSHDFIPIKTADDGDITIVLNGESESKKQYGSVKITPSGNIYILIQESVLQEITKNDSNKHFGIPDLGSKHLIKKNVNPENKFVATHCNAKPDDELCDASKCVCEKKKDNKWFYSEKQDKLKLDKKCGTSLETKSSTESCSTSWNRNPVPHITIKPFDFKTEKIRHNRNKQCYYQFESVCTLQKKNTYDTVPNEISEIFGFSKYSSTNSNDSSGENLDKLETDCESLQESSKRIDWNSLTRLPLQLPPFLKNYGIS